MEPNLTCNQAEWLIEYFALPKPTGVGFPAVQETCASKRINTTVNALSMRLLVQLTDGGLYFGRRSDGWPEELGRRVWSERCSIKDDVTREKQNEIKRRGG